MCYSHLQYSIDLEDAFNKKILLHYKYIIHEVDF